MTPEKMSKLHSTSEANHRIWHAHEFSELLSLPGVITEFHAHGFAIARVVDTAVSYTHLTLPTTMLV